LSLYLVQRPSFPRMRYRKLRAGSICVPGRKPGYTIMRESVQ
jgi:hypothetical protein